MGEEHQYQQKSSNRTKFVVCLAGAAFAALAVFAVYASGNFKSMNDAAAASPEPFLGSVATCGTCQIIPGIDSYKLCSTCRTEPEETTRLVCEPEESIIVTKVYFGHENQANDVSLVYNECEANRNEDGSCAFNLQTLRDIDAGLYEEEYNMDEPAPVETEPVLSHRHSGYKVKYMCLTTEYFQPAEAESEYLLAATRWNQELENVPILSSALVKCGSRKAITDNWEKGKVCETEIDTPITLTCDETRLDTRILVAKVKTSSVAGLDKKLKKNLAIRATELCADSISGSSCSFSFSDLFQEGETAPEAGSEMSAMYVCSYSSESEV